MPSFKEHMKETPLQATGDVANGGMVGYGESFNSTPRPERQKDNVYFDLGEWLADQYRNQMIMRMAEIAALSKVATLGNKMLDNPINTMLAKGLTDIALSEGYERIKAYNGNRERTNEQMAYDLLGNSGGLGMDLYSATLGKTVSPKKYLGSKLATAAISKGIKAAKKFAVFEGRNGLGEMVKDIKYPENNLTNLEEQANEALEDKRTEYLNYLMDSSQW